MRSHSFSRLINQHFASGTKRDYVIGKRRLRLLRDISDKHVVAEDENSILTDLFRFEEEIY